MNSLTAQIIVDIIRHEMNLPAGNVWLRDQNKLIPNDNGLYIVVGMVNAFTLCNEVYMKDVVTLLGTEEHQINEVQQQENIQIDVLSRSNDALTRNIEIEMALQSFYGQQQQELNNFKIFRNPRSFVNSSGAEGGSTLNRYSITISAFVWYRKDMLLSSPNGDYYDDFKQRVDDDKTIGTTNPVAAFEIPPDMPPH